MTTPTASPEWTLARRSAPARLLRASLVCLWLSTPLGLSAQPAPEPTAPTTQAPEAPAATAAASPASSGGEIAPQNPDQTPPPSAVDLAQQAAEIAELKRQVEILATEIDRLRSGEEELPLPEARQRALGLAPSAAAAYRKREGISLAGYGELLFEHFADTLESGTSSPRGAQLDFLRAVLYTGYRFDPRFVFNSEIELEHANEISVEFAYVDYLLSDRLTIRGGMVLLPLGLVNEFHEPTVFLGARRSETETRIIPSTWRENGIGVLGSFDRVQYRAYLVNGLNAAGFTAEGLRGGRQKGSRAKATDVAFAGRVDLVPTPALFVGAALYTGGADQDQFVVDGRPVAVRTTIADVHGQLQFRGIDLRGVYARAVVDGAKELAQARRLTGSNAIGRLQHGGYLHVGYNVLSQFTDRLVVTPYYRFERVNTHAQVPAGFQADPARDGTFHTIGVELRPLYNVVIKADGQIVRTRAHSGRNQFNIALGYAF